MPFLIQRYLLTSGTIPNRVPAEEEEDTAPGLLLLLQAKAMPADGLRMPHSCFILAAAASSYSATDTHLELGTVLPVPVVRTLIGYANWIHVPNVKKNRTQSKICLSRPMTALSQDATHAAYYL